MIGSVRADLDHKYFAGDRVVELVAVDIGHTSRRLKDSIDRRKRDYVPFPTEVYLTRTVPG